MQRKTFTCRWRGRLDNDYESISLWRSDYFAAVVRIPQGLVQVRIVKHFPEPIYDLPIGRGLLGDHPLDRSQCKREKRVAAALQCRSYRLRQDQLAEPHHRRGVSKGLRRG